jgi:hypothetical protein
MQSPFLQRVSRSPASAVSDQKASGTAVLSDQAGVIVGQELTFLVPVKAILVPYPPAVRALMCRSFAFIPEKRADSA